MKMLILVLAIIVSVGAAVPHASAQMLCAGQDSTKSDSMENSADGMGDQACTSGMSSFFGSADCCCLCSTALMSQPVSMGLSPLQPWSQKTTISPIFQQPILLLHPPKSL